jgi:hypothetical protein
MVHGSLISLILLLGYGIKSKEVVQGSLISLILLLVLDYTVGSKKQGTGSEFPDFPDPPTTVD